MCTVFFKSMYQHFNQVPHFSGLWNNFLQRVSLFVLTAVCSFITGKKNETKRIFFSATYYNDSIKSIITTKEHETLVFPNVVSNEGNAYSANDGIFTCPEDGFYYFNYGYLSKKKQGVHVELRVNDVAEVMAYTPADSVYNSAGRGMIIPLKERDEVKIVVRERNVEIYCHLYTSFIGAQM